MILILICIQEISSQQSCHVPVADLHSLMDSSMEECASNTDAVEQLYYETDAADNGTRTSSDKMSAAADDDTPGNDTEALVGTQCIEDEVAETVTTENSYSSQRTYSVDPGILSVMSSIMSSIVFDNVAEAASCSSAEADKSIVANEEVNQTVEEIPAVLSVQCDVDDIVESASKQSESPLNYRKIITEPVDIELQQKIIHQMEVCMQFAIFVVIFFLYECVCI